MSGENRDEPSTAKNGLWSLRPLQEDYADVGTARIVPNGWRITNGIFENFVSRAEVRAFFTQFSPST
jgi:hypothetical protein